MIEYIFKWATPREWLLDRIAKADHIQAQIIAMRLAHKLDGGTVQDLYQNQMTVEGYFIPITKEIE